MKYHIKTITMAVMALASIQLARADILTVTNAPNLTTWDPVGGNAPFYTTSNNFTGVSLSAQGAPGIVSGSSSKYSVVSEYFTITNNGAGQMSASAASSNWTLTAISMLQGGGAGQIQLHLFDITTNLTSNNGSIYNGSGAKYGFSANGDLFGNGLGLTVQNSLSGEAQQTIVLANGPESPDQVVLGVNHTYALEFWIPATNGNILTWYKGSFSDGGGQGMGSKSESLTTNRLTLTSLGLAGGAPRTFALALFGAPTTNSLSVNTDTNLIAPNVYTVDDFSTNGVGDGNPAGDDYFANTNYPYLGGDITNVWANWGLGQQVPPITSISFAPNINVENSSSNGAMQINLTWAGEANTYEQFALWHGNGNTYVPQTNGGTVGIGYPYYTNVECDVRFDGSSVTNTNGVYGDIRIGIRGVSAFGQDWANSSYTTITDTNWHHINGAINPSSADSLNMADAIIGEDATAYVPGGLVGNQILYVDNIRFTGPGGNTVVIPPPKMGNPQVAKPGLRIFAGSSVNTYDREDLYTLDQNQTWVGATPGAPVSYSFSLQDYNPNIGQTMVELIAPPTTPTSDGEYADYSGPTTLWLQLNPAGNGAVIASVQWKTNEPNANPSVTATQFTNSTAIGTWSLVFTGPNTGYVVAPGNVILGSTSFTIADGTVTTDFPVGTASAGVFAVFGLQANNTAGEGAYEDWGFIGITNVADGNEYEDFTKEGSDIASGYTPTLDFETGMSALPSSLIIQTTNDAMWVSWSQPAVGFGLGSTTNLLLNNLVSPGFYSGNNDAIAPRVLPLAAPFAANFWVLLPKDDLPTASGQPNTYTGSNGTPGPNSIPLAPNAFFEVTNSVAP